MFHWLARQVRPYTVGDIIEELVSGHGARMTRRVELHDARDKQWHEQEARALKQDRLEQELEDAEWILDYEKRLANLQKKTAAHRSKAEQAGVNTERVRRLEHHLAGLRRSLD